MQSNTRNICILAHVDHGKTTLSDSLIASNGIISKKMAGKVRYLDSRPDEQLRGITMESSAISLSFKSINQQGQISEYFINLIDSPGHIDFSSEVSSVSRLSDGAIVLVDVVEGICSQTITVLRQAWIDNLKPILVLNKIDRLILELQLSPSDAYDHLNKLIHQTNTIMASFYNGDVIESHSNWNGDEPWIETSEDDIYFHPNSNNVVFTSAYDGWGFNLNQFAAILSKKLGIPKSELDGKLFADYMIDKNKKVVKSKRSNLFIAFILDSIWKIYNSVNDRDIDAITKITSSLNIKVPPKELNSKDVKSLTCTIMSQFLPISNAILSTIIDKLPSPVIAQANKMDKLLDSIPYSDQIDETLHKNLINCNADGILCGYISKMISVPLNELPENQAVMRDRGEYERGKAAKAAELARAAEAEAASKLAKKVNDDVDNNETKEENEEEKEEEREIRFNMDELKLDLDSNFSVSDVPGLEFEDDVEAEKEEEDADADNEFELEFEYEEEEDDEPIVVNQQEEEEEEDLPEDTEALIAFTRIYSGTIHTNDTLYVLSPLYNTSKPYDDESNTPHVHEIKIDKLYRFMGRDLTAMDQISAGSIVGIRSSDFKNIVLKSGTIISPEIVKSNHSINFATSNTINDVPPIVRVTLEPVKLNQMNQLLHGMKLLNLADPCVRGYVSDQGEVVLETAGELHLERCVKDLKDRFAKIDFTVGKPIVPFRETILESVCEDVTVGDHTIKMKLSPLDESVDDVLLKSEKYNDVIINSSGNNSLDGYLKSGFSLAIKEGPIINEPIQNVKVEVLEITSTESENSQNDMILTKIRDQIHDLLLKASPRIMLAMYTVDIQTSAELLGKVYTVIQKQRGNILSEEMKEGTPFFTVQAKLPVLTSFGFSEDIRKRTSGGAIPQLVFDGFEVCEQDPFWVPTTEEEIEELGADGDRENWIRTVMNNVRKSKGLFVDEKVVENAEKQRTLKKD